jgi:hypothetical protein
LKKSMMPRLHWKVSLICWSNLHEIRNKLCSRLFSRPINVKHG